MGTKLNPLAGRYFNDPGIAQAMSNLAGLFGPPDVNDMLAGAQYQGEVAQNDRLKSLWGAAGNDFDKMGVAAGQWTPNQSYYAVNLGDATTRRGQDITASTSIANNTADNSRALDQTRLTTQGAVVGDMMDPNGRNAVDPAFLSAIFGSNTPGVAAAQPVAPTETQVKGTLLSGMSPEEQHAIMGSGVDTVMVDNGQGGATYSTPLDALGQPAFVNTGAEAAPKPIILVDPATGAQTGGFAVGGNYTLADGTPAPAGLIPQNLPQATGSASEIAGPTTANNTEATKVKAEMAYAAKRAAAFQTLLTDNPRIMGVPGMISGLAQDITQAASDLMGAYGDEGKLASLQDVQAFAQKVAQHNGYDPAYAQAAALALEMAYMDAKAGDPQGEVNVRELLLNLNKYDGGIAGNEKVLGNLALLQQKIRDRAQYADDLRNPGGVTIPPIPGTPPPATGAGPVQIQSDAEYDALPSGAEFIAPDGSHRRKP